MVLTRYASRNLRRRKSRTALTVSAVVLAVALVTVGQTMVDGMGDHIMKAFTETTGHVLIRNKSYAKEQRFNPLGHVIKDRRDLVSKLRNLSEVEHVQSRIRFQTMVDYKDTSSVVSTRELIAKAREKLSKDDLAELTTDEDLADAGAEFFDDDQLLGKQTLEFAAAVAIEPEIEKQTSKLSSRIVAGSYLTETEPADPSNAASKSKTVAKRGQPMGQVLLGIDLAKRLGAKPGATIGMVSQNDGMRPAVARVVGIFDLGNRHANRMVYTRMSDAEVFLGMKDQATEMLVFTKNFKLSRKLLEAIDKAGIAKDLEVSEWNTIGIAKTLNQVFGFIVMALLVIIMVVAIAGLLNTMLMSVLERQREIGVLLALGLSRMKVVGTIVLEAVVFGFIGTVIGVGIGLIGSYFLSTYGIHFGEDVTSQMSVPMEDTMYGVMSASSVAWAALIGFVVAIVGSLWPALRASSVQPVDAMRKH